MPRLPQVRPKPGLAGGDLKELPTVEGQRAEDQRRVDAEHQTHQCKHCGTYQREHQGHPTPTYPVRQVEEFATHLAGTEWDRVGQQADSSAANNSFKRASRFLLISVIFLRLVQSRQPGG